MILILNTSNSLWICQYQKDKLDYLRKIQLQQPTSSLVSADYSFREKALVGGDSLGVVYLWSLSRNKLENQIEFKKLRILQIKFIDNSSTKLYIADYDGLFYILEQVVSNTKFLDN